MLSWGYAAVRSIPCARRFVSIEGIELVREKVNSGDRSPTYLREIERYAELNGHIGAWWYGRSIHEVNYATLEDWTRWLAKRRGAGNAPARGALPSSQPLSPKTRRCKFSK
jgi:hypothetical protein